MNEIPDFSLSLRKPNFLLIVVDEERYPPVYEDAQIKEWRRQNLQAQQFLRQNSLEFHRHYIGSTACCPSRATLFTGQYPSLHGVSQRRNRQGFVRLRHVLARLRTVPTMGHYFRAAGYQTYYKGKWHISNEDIIVPGTHQSIPSYDPLTGVPDPLGPSAIFKATAWTASASPAGSDLTPSGEVPAIQLPPLRRD